MTKVNQVECSINLIYKDGKIYAGIASGGEFIGGEDNLCDITNACIEAMTRFVEGKDNGMLLYRINGGQAKAMCVKDIEDDKIKY